MEMQPVFTVRFGQEVEEGQVTVGKFDGKNPCMAWYGFNAALLRARARAHTHTTFFPPFCFLCQPPLKLLKTTWLEGPVVRTHATLFCFRR